MNVAFRFNKPFKRVTHSNPETDIPRFIRILCMYVCGVAPCTHSNNNNNIFPKRIWVFSVCVCNFIVIHKLRMCARPLNSKRERKRVRPKTRTEKICSVYPRHSLYTIAYTWRARVRVRLYSSSLSCRSFVATIVVSRLLCAYGLCLPYAWDVTSTRHIPYVRSFISQAAKCHLSSGAITLYCVQNAAHRAVAASTQSAA